MRILLYEKRKEKGYTQVHLAKLMNITQSAYANYEAGKRTPKHDIVLKLAYFLNFDWHEFYEQEHKQSTA